ncbi:hypothetical protein Hanom_Chr15g01400561 [Helianthus anomalus]
MKSNTRSFQDLIRSNKPLQILSNLYKRFLVSKIGTQDLYKSQLHYKNPIPNTHLDTHSTNWGSPVGHRHPPLPRDTGFKSWEWHMSHRVRTWHGEVTAELAWSGSDSRTDITPTVGRTVHCPRT